jgi:hypothetical protein
MFTQLGYDEGYHMGEQICKGFSKKMGAQLRQPLKRVKCGVMPVENKTEKIVMRVKPSYKKEAEALADAMGYRVVTLFEKALECYKTTTKVKQTMASDAYREALAKQDAPKEGEGS